MNRLDRRRFLELAAAGGGALVGGLLAPPAAAAQRRAGRTRRVVLVAFAGGVRTRETFGSPENVPVLRALADEGVLYTRARTSNLGHFGATLSMFTGVSEARGIRENARGPDPTLFEYVRKDRALSSGEVWVTTSGGAQQANYAWGTHPDYGARYGANTLDGDGIFNRELQALVQAWGRPKALSGREQELFGALRGALRSGRDEEGAREREASRRVESFVMDELARGTASLTGANSGDAKALRVARNLLALFRPALTTIVLQDADVAHGSYNAYVDVIRRNDAMLGEIVETIRSDPELADSTALFVQPEFGRDRDLNARRGLDHGDGSEDLSYVACLAWGPDFRQGEVVKEDVRTIDVAPTVCALLGAEARYSKGRPLPRLYS